jgi:SAM-dependent methyltransferase
MTGLDFSAASLEQARKLASDAGADVDFVLADVTEAASVLEAGAFDLVYTGIGALCWLPDVRRWAGVVAALLSPGGRLFIREGHPVTWALDYQRDDGELTLTHPYDRAGHRQHRGQLRRDPGNAPQRREPLVEPRSRRDRLRAARRGPRTDLAGRARQRAVEPTPRRRAAPGRRRRVAAHRPTGAAAPDLHPPSPQAGRPLSQAGATGWPPPRGPAGRGRPAT